MNWFQGKQRHNGHWVILEWLQQECDELRDWKGKYMLYVENNDKIEWYCNNSIGISAIRWYWFSQCVGCDLGNA